MGTHPIFESDFDCLTDKQNRTKWPTQKVFDVVPVTCSPRTSVRREQLVSRLTSPVTEREISSISRVMVLSKRVCHTRSTTVPLDVSSQNASMSALNTSSTPNLVKVSSTVLLPTTLPSRTPRPLAPTSMSRESISNHVK